MQTDNENWLINIQNTGREVAEQVGKEVVDHILQMHGATSIEELLSSEYDQVFSELDFIASDLR